jgi:osmotically-inducible protein OsmY
VYLTSNDSTDATRKRAIEVAAAVSGVTGVEADMK